MLESKRHKVLVLGLPKSGTSTLATMLRMLGYQVTGPNLNIKSKKDLLRIFEAHEAFQDYPWCFEYPLLLKQEGIKVIVLKREQKAWVKSFKESYGGKNDNYLSYKYMKLSKNEPDQAFYDYHSRYYSDVIELLKLEKIDFIELSLSCLNWSTICTFLDKPIPKNMFGYPSHIPKVNSKNYKNSGFGFKFKKQLKKDLHSLLGKHYFKLTSFIYRNK